MKKIYLFFIFLLISGCGYNLSSNNTDTIVSCPSILFSSEDKIYIGSSENNISMDNVEYRGEINNAIFTKKCIIKDGIFLSELSILYIMEPLFEYNVSFEAPFYLAVLDANKKLQDMLYFSMSSTFKINYESGDVIETDFIKKLPLVHRDIDENSIIIVGYILDKKRKEILN